jgi:aminopeptidase N
MDNPSRTRNWDLLHTDLDVRFDFPQAQLPGIATLTLTPYFYPTDSLVLDAKGFKILSVGQVDSGTSALAPFPYTYNNRQITIRLPRVFAKSETLRVSIQYVARPNELKEQGSAAITDAKGLYFINNTGQDGPHKPLQVWTQGETEASSCWFPTLDAPNERCTQLIRMTVPDTLVTLSNGLCTSRRKNADGTRTDTWEMTIPHAPYLFMMAVGRYAVVVDKWRDKDVEYYVEPAYEPYARMIFGKTPRMMEFFSKQLGVDYMWPKYSQVVCRDYVSGAMENTSATVFMEDVQQDRRGWLDNTYEDIVAHELYHHWFGDYVTCENWANLPLNESFATYGEVLWFEHEYGADMRDWQLQQDRESYLDEAEIKREPLIRYGYKFREDMFDRHSYQKGGQVLHMLRQEVGDDAFFASLKLYLTRNALTDVEIDELRLAFEDVTGRDLRWFFDQWFLKAGHPELVVSLFPENPVAGACTLRVRQQQDTRFSPVFQLPTQVLVDYGTEKEKIPVRILSKDTILVVSLKRTPLNIELDPERLLLATQNLTKPVAFWVQQLKTGNYRARQEAITYLFEKQKEQSNVELGSLILAQLRHPFWGDRKLTLDLVKEHPEVLKLEGVAAKIRQLVAQDPEAKVRFAALEAAALLEGQPPAQQAALYKQALVDSSYKVCGLALTSLARLEPTAALDFLDANPRLTSSKILGARATAALLAQHPDGVRLAVSALRSDIGFQDKRTLIFTLAEILNGKPDGPDLTLGYEKLTNMAIHDPQWYYRYFAVAALHTRMGGRAEVKAFVQERLRNEPNEEVKQAWKNNLGL